MLTRHVPYHVYLCGTEPDLNLLEKFRTLLNKDFINPRQLGSSIVEDTTWCKMYSLDMAKSNPWELVLSFKGGGKETIYFNGTDDELQLRLEALRERYGSELLKIKTLPDTRKLGQ